MADEPITLTLSPFEKLQILRKEQADRTAELDSLEAEIRERLYRVERRKYLDSMSSYYASHTAPDVEPTDVASLEQQRQELKALIQTIKTQIPQLLTASPEAETPPAGLASPARKLRFDSF